MKKRINMFTIVSMNLLVSLSLLSPIPPVSAGEKVVMVCTRSENDPEGKWLNLIFTEAFKRMGMELVYRHYPAKRCSYLSDKGQVDGELWRVRHYNEGHPDMVRVEEPHGVLRFSAFATDPNIQLDGWDSLKDTAYRVECRRGIRTTCEKFSVNNRFILQSDPFQSIYPPVHVSKIAKDAPHSPGFPKGKLSSP